MDMQGCIFITLEGKDACESDKCEKGPEKRIRVKGSNVQHLPQSSAKAPDK